MYKISAIFFLSLMLHNTDGLQCYTCSIGEDDADTTCLDDPSSLANGGLTDCDKKYCIIIRLDYKDPRGKLNSLIRTCVDKPTYLNEVIEDETFRTYYRSCRTDKCNSGSGRSDSSNSESGALGDKSTIYIPGIGPNGAASVCVSMIILMLALFPLLL